MTTMSKPFARFCILHSHAGHMVRHCCRVDRRQGGRAFFPSQPMTKEAVYADPPPCPACRRRVRRHRSTLCPGPDAHHPPRRTERSIRHLSRRWRADRRGLRQAGTTRFRHLGQGLECRDHRGRPSEQTGCRRFHRAAMVRSRWCRRHRRRTDFIGWTRGQYRVPRKEQGPVELRHRHV